MNEKEIRNISITSLFDVWGQHSKGFYYEGCLIASYIDIPDTDNDQNGYIGTFRYPARINAFIVIFCLNGSISLTCNLKNYTLNSKTSFVGSPGSILQLEFVKGASVHAFIFEEEFIRRINIDIKLLSHSFLSIDSSPCIEMSDDVWEGVARSIEDILAEGSVVHNDVYSPEIMYSAMRILAYKICRCIGMKVENSPRLQSAPGNRREEYFKEFMHILSKYYIQERSVGFYASKMYLTPKYLTTIIRKTTGRTAIQWINEYVVLEAKNLLKYSTMNIQEIANYLNFSNQSFFGKYFKHHTGMTPTEYRISK